jgi:dihydroneopterin aldolase
VTVQVEIHGLEVAGRHGVDDEERRREQTFLFDVELIVPQPRADEIGATVDYRKVRDVVRRVSAADSYALLETLAAAACDAVLSELPVQSVRVRVRKPGVAWAEWTAATVERVSGS